MKRDRILTIKLPSAGGLEEFAIHEPRQFQRPKKPFTRKALAAAHVVADPFSAKDPWLDAAIDWDATLAYRRHLWSWGFGVAEAMDTAQRGMGLDWTNSLELVRRSIQAAGKGDVVASGAGTDHLPAGKTFSIAGNHRRLRRAMRGDREARRPHHPDGEPRARRFGKVTRRLRQVYDRILSQVKQPVIIHWLGEMFDPALEGYWGKKDHYEAMDVCVSVLRKNVEGIKISLLDKDKEIVMRRKLPKGVRMYTGDDFNFAELIEGDAQGYSDALLGIFDSIAPAASQALSYLKCRRKEELSRGAGAHGPAVAPHLQGADALLQDRRGVHGVAEWPPGPLRDGRRPAVGAQRAAFQRAVPPRRCRRAARRSAAGVRAHEAIAWLRTDAAEKARQRSAPRPTRSARTSDEVWQAFFAAQVLVFRGQKFTPSGFLAFAKQFGKPEPHVIDQFHHPEHADILILSNVEKDGKPTGLADAGTYFHTDYSYLEVPARVHDAVLDPGAEQGRRYAVCGPVRRL